VRSVRSRYVARWSMVAAAVAAGRRLAPATSRFLAVSSSKLVQHEKSSSEVRATRTESTWNFA
jgi:hypothetical protein